MNSRRVQSGEFAFSPDGLILLADVQQDVAVCVYDHQLGCGGMAVCSVIGARQILADLFKAFKGHGSLRTHLTVKVAGGGEIGQKSSVEAQVDAFCRDLGIPVKSRSTGGAFGRSIRLDTRNGEMLVKKNTDRPNSEQPTADSAAASVHVDGRAKKIRVLIVDDSPVIRSLFRKALGSEPDIDIFGLASDPMAAEKLMTVDVPDVITLDMQMPGMDGLTYIETHLAARKIPIIVVTGAGPSDGDLAFKALDAGALDFVEKPSAENMASFCRELAEKVRTASQINKAKLTGSRSCIVKARPKQKVETDRVIVIGSSTGGTAALTNILTALGEEIPPILIVQHIPPVFSRLFAERLNSLVPFEVREASHHDQVLPGRVLIAPGGRQMKIKYFDKKLVVAVTDDPPVNKHAPSVDYLFDSVAEVLGGKAVAAILTGMGKDGAQGMLKLRQRGCPTIAQDEATSVVYGMPREAARVGAVDHILPLQDIPDFIVGLCSTRTKRNSA